MLYSYKSTNTDTEGASLDDTLPGFTSATTAARKKLFELSRTVIAAAEAFVDNLQKSVLRSIKAS